MARLALCGLPLSDQSRFEFNRLNRLTRCRQPHPRDQRSADFGDPLLGELGKSKRRQILLAPEEVRHCCHGFVLEGAIGGEFGDQVLMQFRKCRRAFAGKDAGGGIETPYWNSTPILVSSRQMILQIRVGRSDIAKLNLEGSPYVVWT